MAIEKFSTLLPRNGQGKRILKSKLLTALGSTGVLSPYPQNPERILERKILLQAAFNANPVSPVVPLTLLSSLTAYWKMDTAAFSTRIDSTANGLDLVDKNSNLITEAGVINLAAAISQSLASNALTHTANPLFLAGAGVSFSLSCWIKTSALIANHGIISMDDTVNKQFDLYNDGTNIIWLCFENGTLIQRTLNVVLQATPGVTNYHHYAFGYDASQHQIWCQYDNGARQTAACADVNAGNAAFAVGNFSTFASPNQLSMDELGFWRRYLTLSNVSSLFGGGTPPPFSSFGSIT